MKIGVDFNGLGMVLLSCTHTKEVEERDGEMEVDVVQHNRKIGIRYKRRERGLCYACMEKLKKKLEKLLVRGV